MTISSKELSYELLGVIVELENNRKINGKCMRTLKKVYQALVLRSINEALEETLAEGDESERQ
jgi:hypothetical protein